MKITEKINENTQDIDQLSSNDFVQACIDEDKRVFEAIALAKEEIAFVIEEIYLRIKSHKEVYEPHNAIDTYVGPKVFYFGAGTSGRLGILDASEIPPTFSAHPDFFNGVIAGGERAIQHAVENAEDNQLEAQKFIDTYVSSQDIVIGISANGNAAYVNAAIEAARNKHCFTVAISNNEDALIFKTAEHKIFLDTGPEIITGSTRLKAGTSQKLVLNMISTGLMVKLGKVYGNLMVDLQAKNKKLKDRALNLVKLVCKCEEDKAQKALKESSYRVKDAIVMIKKGLSHADAQNLLADFSYNLRKIIG